MRVLHGPVLALLVLATTVSAIDITTPGQTIHRGDPGVLQADITCGPLEAGIELENGAQLFLNGHKLDGCDVVGNGPTPTAPTRIAVAGPGSIHHAGISLRQGKLKVRDLHIEDAPYFGILGSGDANDGPSQVTATNVEVTGCGATGIQATKVSARDVTSSDNGGALPYAAGIVGWAGVKASGLTATGNQGDGVYVSWGPLRLRDATLTGNRDFGAIGDPSIKIVRSTLTGNGQADVASQLMPNLRSTTCGTSLNAQTLMPWGICAND